MVKFVENELLAIKEEVNDMWLLVHQQLENAFNALRNNDDDLANSVASREKRVNAFELKIDSDIEDFIALYNPAFRTRHVENQQQSRTHRRLRR